MKLPHFSVMPQGIRADCSSDFHGPPIAQDQELLQPVVLTSIEIATLRRPRTTKYDVIGYNGRSGRGGGSKQGRLG